MTTITATEIRCTAAHDRILIGFAGIDNAPGSFGEFIADVPVGAELLSVSGWLCRWTGDYVDDRGHRAARLKRIRQSDPSRRDAAEYHGWIGQDALIHTCGVNCWSATGRYVVGVRPEAVVEVQHSRGQIRAVCSVHGFIDEPRRFADREGRELAHFVAAEHARTHPRIDVTGWRRWTSERLEAALDVIDDSTELYDKMAAELDQRDHEHQTRINNGGVLP